MESIGTVEHVPRLVEIAGALIALDDTLPSARGDARRLPGSERNQDRAALLVVTLQARGFVVTTKAEYDRAVRIERAARLVAEDASPYNLAALIGEVGP